MVKLIGLKNQRVRLDQEIELHKWVGP